MAKERVSMRKVKEILRLYWEEGLSRRQIARSCSISRSAVSEYIARAQKAGLRHPLPEELDDATIEAKLFPKEEPTGKAIRPMPAMEEIHRELQKKGVTLQLLWLEYKDKYPEGYQYSQFCELYRKWKSTLGLTLRQEHRAGEKMFVDFAGQTIPVTNPTTGEVTQSEIFVAVLGASNYTYSEALESQALPCWIRGHVNGYEYFGGVASVTVPDNLKSGVTKTCRYEPDINTTYYEMSRHYGTVIIPARPGKPKDKAKVEAGVLLVSRWIIAALRNYTFFSIEEVNKKIKELLERLNNRKFKTLNTSRKELFLSLDKPALKPLPLRRYEYARFMKTRVKGDYHVEVEGHYYSVPYQLAGKVVEVRVTLSTVEVLYEGRRIATHKRSFDKGKLTTINEHRPKSHQKHLELTTSSIISWAQRTGPSTTELIETIISTKPHPEQSHRSCLGIFRLSVKYTADRIEAASLRAISLKAYSYKSMKSILESGFDKLSPAVSKETAEPINHDNIRGNHYYN